MSALVPPTRERIAERARELYESCISPRPQWSTLGETTRKVWAEYAERELAGVQDWWRAP